MAGCRILFFLLRESVGRSGKKIVTPSSSPVGSGRDRFFRTQVSVGIYNIKDNKITFPSFVQILDGIKKMLFLCFSLAFPFNFEGKSCAYEQVSAVRFAPSLPKSLWVIWSQKERREKISFSILLLLPTTTGGRHNSREVAVVVILFGGKSALLQLHVVESLFLSFLDMKSMKYVNYTLEKGGENAPVVLYRRSETR